MSTRAVQFDSEASRSLPRNATQQDSRCERREGREGRESNRSRGRTSEAEPTEVSVSHKKAHGKSSEKGIQSSQISKARVHSASAKSGENSLQTLEYAPSTQYTSSGNTQDHSSKASSSLYASMHTTELGRAKFMGNIPGIPAASEQSSQRGDFAGCTLFPPPSVCKYGQNVAYPTSSSSDFKPMPQDSIDTTDLIFHKSSANRYATGARNKSQADTKMQWNATHENYRLREEQKNRTVPSEFHHTRTRAGRRGKDGVNIVYNEVKISGSNRANIPRRSTSASSYSESPTDSQGSSTESESLSSSDAASIKRKRRIRRKPSNKSIGSSIYGEDNTSESESQSVGELSASDNANSYRKRRTQCLREKDDMGSVVGLKEHRSTLNRLRSSSLTSVSSLEGTGIHGDHPSRNPSPQLSQKGSSIAKVKKIQIRSFTSFADCQSYMTYMYNKENLPQRRRSTEERAEPFKMEKSRSPMSRQGTESPSLSRSPFGLKAKKGSRELLSSDSECNFASDKEHTTAQGNSVMLDERVGQDQVNQESKSGACYPTETRESRLNQNPTNELHTNSWSDFVPIKVSNRTGNNEPNLSVITQVAFDEDSRCEKSDVLIQPVARNSHNRPLSVVQETDEYADITQDGDCYRNEHVEKILKKSHFRTYEARRSPPSEDRNASISSLRRLSYVKAQTNSATVPVDSPDEKDQKDMNSNYYESLSSGFSPLYSENSTSRIYRMEVSNETKRVLEEFDPKPTVTSPIAEVDLISFEDESVERKQPVKKRTKKIIRPKIPTILGGEEETERKTSKADLPNLEITRSVSEKNEVSFSTGMFDGSKRDGIIVCGSDEDCTPQATSEVEDNQAVGVPHYDCRNKNKVSEKVKLENKRSSSLEGSCKSPTSGMAQDDKRKSSLPKDSGKTQKSKHDLRAHVVKNLLDTEVSYVQNLQFLVSSYYKALKKQDNAGIVEPAQVDEMFYQIPEILLCHEFFLKQLQARVNEWHDKQKIGDIFVSSFTKCFLVDAYSAFINHFLQARAAVRVATMSRPAFVRYMEQCSRDHKEKLTLQDLMIMPVQRIPRYELILKDMIKHTPHDHPDHGSLQLALGEIKTLADRMNRGEKEVDQAEREAERLRDLETTIEGMTELVTPTRRLIRQDLVAEVKGTITKKDRCLFLFNDMLACATVKRRANALRRFSSGSGTEFQKYKLLWRLHLDYVEVYKSSPEAQRRNSLEKQLEKLDTDMSSLSKISALADNLTITHMALDAAIQELMNEVNRQISEKQIPLQPPTSTKLELHAQTEEGEELFQFLFLETEIKNSWEAYFEDAKQKLAYAKDTFPPEFQNCIPINKTRSGMQFTCASPCQVPHMLDRGNHCGSGDVWVCNSDGYVGQVCILRMGSQIQPCGSITVCMSRILCISPVPGTKFIGMEALQSESETKSDTQSISLSSEKSGKTNTNRQVSHSGFASDEDVAGPQNIMAFDSSSEDEEGLGADSFLGGKFTDGNSPLFDVDGRLSPEGSSLGTTGSADGLDSSADENVFDFEENDSSCDEMKGKGSRKHSKRRIATSRSQSKDSLDPENFETDEPCTVWLGTEDGCIFLYPANETQNKKSKLKIQLSGSIQCILYVDNQVFISLSTGHLYIYRRQPGCAWEVGNPVMLHIGDSSAVSCMTAIHGRLWCGLGCNAVIVNTTTLAVETSFNCSLDKDRSVYRMASSGMGVWISLQSSAAVRLFHATRYECLADVDVAPPVHKMLASSDAIIRQHKAACLRVTALLACKDLLWIGTSAGVVLTLPLPTITASTASLRNCPSATASFHGHTGHVRFLTAVEVPKEGTHDNAIEKGSGTSPSSPTAPLQSGGNSNRDVLIISGGDGYEDFRASSASESAGRDDSTNHLLIWRV